MPDRSGSQPPRSASRNGVTRAGDGRPVRTSRPDESQVRTRSKADEPDLPDEVAASDLDPAVRRDLLSLDKTNAERVARHLVMAGALVDDDPRLALTHARSARDRAARVAVVREAVGITAYHAEEWAEALNELRAARRMAGGPGLVAVMADCERALGRPERAIELARSPEAQQLDAAEATELRIVVAGARRDLGQLDSAIVSLQTHELDAGGTGTSYARLTYAYADALAEAGRTDDAVRWFLTCAEADTDGDTDVEDRLAELGAAPGHGS